MIYNKINSENPSLYLKFSTSKFVEICNASGGDSANV